jgi:hypothetical protein
VQRQDLGKGRNQMGYKAKAPWRRRRVRRAELRTAAGQPQPAWTLLQSVDPNNPVGFAALILA